MMPENDNNDRGKKIQQIYRYDEMSNKVLKADKSLNSFRTDPERDAAISQPKTMAGKISVKEMGSLVNHEVREDERAAYQRQIELRTNSKSSTVSRRKATNSTILGTDSVEALIYHPSDQSNALRYDELVGKIATLLGDDIPHDIILSAVDFVLQTLKGDSNDEKIAIERKKEQIEESLSTRISRSSFHDIIEIVKKITDYHSAQEAQDDNEVGVAILADEEENEESEDENLLTNEVVEEEQEEDRIEGEQNSPPQLQNDDVATYLSTQTPEEDVLTFKPEDSESITTKDRVPIYEVDEHFLARKISSFYKDSDHSELQSICSSVNSLLEAQLNDAQLEGRLSNHFDLSYYPLIKFICRNRDSLYWGKRLAESSLDERRLLLKSMRESGLDALAEEYESRTISHKRKLSSETKRNESKKPKVSSIPQELDLKNLVFDQGAELMTSARVTLPAESFKRVKQGYEEIHVPPPSRLEEQFSLVPITALPSWARDAFPSNEMTTLNRIQSEVYPSAFDNEKNMLICAPTGSGKTNIAMLAILKTLSCHLNKSQKGFDLKSFKMVYIAPLKALVQEQVREFQRRLSTFGIKVGELTGDSNLTRQQILESTLLVSTPEKWDIITRKTADNSYSNLVELLIIDEIHLLHDERGPVLESIVARTIKEATNRVPTRIVALSATLPNYRDVAEFLRVPDENLFYFDSSFRPCPLAQQFCGITEVNGIKRINAMNQACYDKLFEVIKNGHQAIVFVHSRKDTARTALWLKNKLVEEEKIQHFVKSEPGSKEILSRESENVTDNHLAELIQYGFGIHHAGLTKADRSLSEDLFADGLLSVLVSTATLAWGVNLPAHAVIIKGTDVYSPEKGTWTRLSPQDVLQMLGRAGRPRYDTFGEGIIITQQASVQYYLAMLNQQLPIESQFISRLCDNLNSEVVLGNIGNREDAVNWLGHTYLYVRMLKSPALYGVPDTYASDDPTLLRYRDQLAHSALKELHSNHLVVYDEQKGTVISTELGRIASHFYIKYHSMSMYNKTLNSHFTAIEILRLFSMSDEFRFIPVREEERLELQKLLEKAPIPIQESAGDSMAKVNVLLQSYISRSKLDGFAMKSDMLYITQSAGRLMRALFELSIKKGWSKVSKSLLTLCKSIEKRSWITNSAFRQFKDCPSEVIRHAEASFLPWSDYFSLSSPREVGEAIRSEKHGKVVFDLLRKFPRLELSCSVQPLTPSVLQFQLEILPKWSWDTKLHGFSEPFLVILEDQLGEKLQYHKTLTIKQNYVNTTLFQDFTIFLDASQQQKLPVNFFLTIVSNKWMHCEVKIPILMEDVRLPKKFPAPTPLLNLERVPATELGSEEFANAISLTHFNKIQSQVFSALYGTNNNVFIGTAPGSGRTVMAEVALFNLWSQAGNRAVFISPSEDRINARLKDWSARFSNLAGGKVINKFGDDNLENLRLLAESHLILCTPEQFDLASRRWRQRKNIQRIELMILDNAHLIGDGVSGAVYEHIVSRMTFISAQLETSLRIIALANSLANSRDFGEWIGASKENIYNFSPTDRERALQIQIQSVDQAFEAGSLINKTVWPIFKECSEQQDEIRRIVLFTPSSKQCIQIVSQLLRMSSQIHFESFLHYNGSQSLLQDISSPLVRNALKWGIGVIHGDMKEGDRKLVMNLYNDGHLNVLVSSHEYMCQTLQASNVVVLGTSRYEGREHRHVSYSINELQSLIRVASSSAHLNKVTIVTSPEKRQYYKKFLSEPLPVESYMYFHLPDAIANEISAGIIETRQDCIDWLTYTLFYRRIHANPSFYGVKDVSPLGISAFLTEVVEDVVKDLTDSSFIEADQSEDGHAQTDEEQDPVLLPLNGCLIGAHYNVSTSSLQIFHDSLSRSSGLNSILEALCQSSEFEMIPLREDEATYLKELCQRMPLNPSGIVGFESSAFKAYVLLQAHFSRFHLRDELNGDLTLILRKAVPLVNSLVDLLAGDGNLNATIAMDLSQMLTQGMWDTDSPLLQIPFFDANMVKKCDQYNVETVYDIMALEDDERTNLLTFKDSELTSIANFVNSYPNVELSYSTYLTDQLMVGNPFKLSVTLTRDEEPDSLFVVAERFPYAKKENWWIVVGKSLTKEVLAIKKVILSKETQEYELDVVLDEPGKHNLTLWCVCDSYVDADKEVSFEMEAF